MNKFIVKPNRTLEEIIELNYGRVEHKEPFLDEQFWFDRGYQYFEGRLRSPMYVQNKIMSRQKVTSNIRAQGGLSIENE